MILDTNALSAWAEGRPAVESPLRNADRLIVPIVVLGEFYYGIRLSRHRDRYEDWLRKNLPLTNVAVLTHATALAYAEIRIDLRHSGKPIPVNDVWIAALARQLACPVLSNDAHFDAVAEIERIGF